MLTWIQIYNLLIEMKVTYETPGHNVVAMAIMLRIKIRNKKNVAIKRASTIFINLDEMYINQNHIVSKSWLSDTFVMFTCCFEKHRKMVLAYDAACR